MKNKIFLFFLIFSLCSGIVFWDCNDCKIKDEPGLSLDTYITNLRKVVSNISSEVSKVGTTSWVKKDISSTKSKIIWVYNTMINWNGYYSYFHFYVTYSLQHEYVSQVWRDYTLLEKESAGLEKYLKFLTNKWFDSTNLTKEKICAGISDSCDFEWDILDVVGKVISNHEAMKDYYRLSILWEKNKFSWKLILIGNDFETNFWECYNEATTSNCGQCEKGGFTKITEEIAKITDWQKNAKDWIKSWQDAIAMIDGSGNKRDNEKRERELLSKELSRNGLSLEASNQILSNLDRYNNSWGFSLENNFITNTFNYIKKSVTSQIIAFRDSVTQSFRKKETSVSTQAFWKTNGELQTTKNIEETIRNLYQQELDYAQLQDNSTQNLQAKIIEIHYNISQSINTLDRTIKISEKVCNSQDKWEWICDTK